MNFDRTLPFVILSLCLLLHPSQIGATPTIQITSVPPYAEDGFLSGSVAGVDVATHKVAVYIQIEGLGWWSKPTAVNRSVPINADGTFTADVATGGLDNRATIYCAALIETSTNPPLAQGTARIPKDLVSKAIDCKEHYSRTIQFAGRTWALKEAPAGVGPGQNYFSNQPDDVFVDESGRLHLTIRFHDGVWWATEVILLEHLGYGTYSFQTESRVDTLDVNVTFGAFTWDPYGDEETIPAAPHREIDFEDSRWGSVSELTTSQGVIQPFSQPGNLKRYAVPDLSSDPSLTRIFAWTLGRIEFTALRGHQPAVGFAPESRICTWVETADPCRFVYTHEPASSHVVPTPSRETFRFNLWPNNVELGGPPPPRPADGQAVEIIVTAFEFAPMVTIAPTTPIAKESPLTNGVFTVTRTGSTAAALTVSYKVGGTATPGIDYTMTPSIDSSTLGGSVTIPAGAQAATITVVPKNDTLVEGDETVVVALTAASGYTMGSPLTATVTIVSDDVPPPSVVLAVSLAGSAPGRVMSSPAGIDCNTTCLHDFVKGTTVTLTAADIPGAGGSTFKKWRGDACNESTRHTCQVVMDATKSVTAVFSKRFTDDPLISHVTPVKVAHLTELREAINTLRVHRTPVLPVFNWVDAAPAPGGAVRASHLSNLRTALSEIQAQTYAEPTITPGTTPIKANHLTELRALVRALE